MKRSTSRRLFLALVVAALCGPPLAHAFMPINIENAIRSWFNSAGKLVQLPFRSSTTTVSKTGECKMSMDSTTKALMVSCDGNANTVIAGPGGNFCLQNASGDISCSTFTSSDQNLRTSGGTVIPLPNLDSLLENAADTDPILDCTCTNWPAPPNGFRRYDCDARAGYQQWICCGGITGHQIVNCAGGVILPTPTSTAATPTPTKTATPTPTATSTAATPTPTGATPTATATPVLLGSCLSSTTATWNFEEASAPRDNAQGTAANDLANGSATQNTTSGHFVWGSGSAEFSGTTGNTCTGTTCTALAASLTGSFTVMGYAYESSHTANAALLTNTDFSNGFHVETTASNVLRLGLSVGGSGLELTSGAPTGTLYHWAGTWTTGSNAATLYEKDGASNNRSSSGTVVYVPPASSASPGASVSGIRFTGQEDQIVVYPAVLSAANICRFCSCGIANEANCTRTGTVINETSGTSINTTLCGSCSMSGADGSVCP